MRIVVLVLLLVCEAIPFASLRAEEVLSWEQCVAEARSRHPDLQSAMASIRAAEEERKIAGSPLLPSLSVQGGARELGYTGSRAGSAGAQYSYALAGAQLLYDGGKSSGLARAAGEGVKGAESSREAVSADVRFALRSAFTSLLKAQEYVTLAADIQGRRLRNVRLIGLRYRAGREHIGSLRKAEADLADAEFEVARASRGLGVSRSALSTAMGRGLGSTHLKVRGSFTAVEPAEQRPDFMTLASESPVVRSLEARMRASGFDLRAARSAFSPELSLSSSIGRSAADDWNPDESEWRVGLDLAVPIYEGGSGRAGVAKARAVVSRDEAELKSGLHSVLDLLEERWKSYLDALQYVAVRKKFLEAAVERAAIANARYSNGLISFDDWVIIEDSLVSAKKEFLNAGADLLIAEAQWIQSKGEGLDGIGE
ncbi:TolC family protein [Chlorobium phaeovibrioides]|uniref:TolC family protein n=1 Tax=Chlorobium phaeovibrioides TaxID=1094 RepID=A0ABW9UQY1_CHLPH|nr:TolC family protein [Chlorobium phaeovibrioides]MWV54647.1 TolC family protein [Chlorobium phaeovibrioides]RTY34835.1 TolC family protein [Chlorobium phaeovibrioides]